MLSQSRNLSHSIRFGVLASRLQAHTVQRSFSEWTGGGTDLLVDSLGFGRRPKVVLEGYAPTGFDVSGVIQKVDKEQEDHSSGEIHMDGSVMVFPHSCFLWDVKNANEVTLESLSPVFLFRPALRYLFIGCNTPLPREELQRIKKEFKADGDVVVEQLDLANAMGTFNILNGEDRLVATALVVDKE